MKFGIYFLMRKSEFLPGRIVGSTVKSKGLAFKWLKFADQNGVEIQWKYIQRVRAYSVCINIRKSKTDQLGKGRIIRHNRVAGEDCIVKDLERWIAFCRDTMGSSRVDFLFQFGNQPLIDSMEVGTVMKIVVEHLGWDSSKISPHSLRYGGATMLAAAGIPQYLIEHFGGWTEGSESLRFYTQVGGDAISRVSQVMADGFKVSLAESRLRVSNQLSIDKVGGIRVAKTRR